MKQGADKSKYNMDFFQSSIQTIAFQQRQHDPSSVLKTAVMFECIEKRLAVYRKRVAEQMGAWRQLVLDESTNPQPLYVPSPCHPHPLPTFCHLYITPPSPVPLTASLAQLLGKPPRSISLTLQNLFINRRTYCIV